MAELYDRYSGALFGVAYRILRSREESEDLLQEIFLQIWEKIDTFDAEKGTLYTWMNRIVRNRALDVLRSRSHRDQQKNRSIEDSVSQIEAENQVIHNPETIGLQGTVESLEPELKEVVESLYFKGNTQSEASEELAIPLGTVKTRARRALKVLRKKMNLPGT